MVTPGKVLVGAEFLLCPALLELAGLLHPRSERFVTHPIIVPVPDFHVEPDLGTGVERTRRILDRVADRIQPTKLGRRSREWRRLRRDRSRGGKRRTRWWRRGRRGRRLDLYHAVRIRGSDDPTKEPGHPAFVLDLPPVAVATGYPGLSARVEIAHPVKVGAWPGSDVRPIGPGHDAGYGRRLRRRNRGRQRRKRRHRCGGGGQRRQRRG